jgi:hypothetical protein
MGNRDMDKLKAVLCQKTDSEVAEFERELAAISKPLGEIYATADVKAAITRQSPDIAEQGVFSFIPTSLTRTSPFFPMSKQEMKSRSLPAEGLCWETSWGRLTIKGERLSIHDESVLLAVLWVMGKRKHGLTFETTRHELCGVLGVTPCRNTYRAVWASLDRLTGTKINLEVWAAGSKRKATRRLTNTILSGAVQDEDTGKLTISVNPYFLEMYAESLITNINLEFRAGLKTDIAKALYRFYRGQRGMAYECHLLTLCHAINLDVDQPLFRLRSRIRAGLKELKRAGYLKRSLLTKSDIVRAWKADQGGLVQLRMQKAEKPHQ